MAVVYWAHLPEHTDMFSEGYIGITRNTLHHRILQHKLRAKISKGHFSNALNRYGDSIVFEVIIIAELPYCAEMESKLRPKSNIGWNILQGGSIVSEETVLKLRKINLTREVPEIIGIKVSKWRQGFEGNKLGEWESLRTNPNMWKNAIFLYELYLEYSVSSLPLKDFLNITGIPKTTLFRLINKFKSGWNPNEDQNFLDWLSSNT